MTALKKTSPSPNSAYKLAAAARRAKVASMGALIVGEVRAAPKSTSATRGTKPLRDCAN